MKYSFTLNILVQVKGFRRPSISRILEGLENGRYEIETVGDISGNPTCILRDKVINPSNIRRRK